jgi:hypothetical protein
MISAPMPYFMARGHFISRESLNCGIENYENSIYFIG